MPADEDGRPDTRLAVWPHGCHRGFRLAHGLLGSVTLRAQLFGFPVSSSNPLVQFRQPLAQFVTLALKP